jgi:hypothetical protein
MSPHGVNPYEQQAQEFIVKLVKDIEEEWRMKDHLAHLQREQCKPGPVMDCYSPTVGLNTVELVDGKPTVVPPKGLTPDQKEDWIRQKDKEMTQREWNIFVKKHTVHEKVWPPGSGRRKQRFTNIDAYIAFRNSIFGSSVKYWEFALQSDEELAENTFIAGKLPDKIGKIPDSQKKEGIEEVHYFLYRWYRKAMIDKHNDPNLDVPSIVSTGATASLRQKLSALQGQGLRDLRAVLVARPAKITGRFRLGSLSNHGEGLAVDYKSGENAHLTEKQYANIQNFVNPNRKPPLNAAAVKGLQANWKTMRDNNLKGLWQKFHDLNRDFVAQVNTELTAAENAAGPGAGKRSAARANRLSQIQRSLGLKREYMTGFFRMTWNDLKAITDEGFTWGVTFLDLHHFDL